MPCRVLDLRALLPNKEGYDRKLCCEPCYYLLSKLLIFDEVTELSPIDKSMAYFQAIDARISTYWTRNCAPRTILCFRLSFQKSELYGGSHSSLAKRAQL